MRALGSILGPVQEGRPSGSPCTASSPGSRAAAAYGSGTTLALPRASPVGTGVEEKPHERAARTGRGPGAPQGWGCAEPLPTVPGPRRLDPTGPLCLPTSQTDPPAGGAKAGAVERPPAARAAAAINRVSWLPCHSSPGIWVEGKAGPGAQAGGEEGAVRDREHTEEGQLLEGGRRKDERGEGRGGRGMERRETEQTDRLRRWAELPWWARG